MAHAALKRRSFTSLHASVRSPARVGFGVQCDKGVLDFFVDSDSSTRLSGMMAMDFRGLKPGSLCLMAHAALKRRSSTSLHASVRNPANASWVAGFKAARAFWISSLILILRLGSPG